MNIQQTKFSFKMIALSDLHVGSGEIDQLEYESDKAIQFAAIARDNNEKPCIPYSGLKGPLKRKIANVASDLAKQLFGSIKDESGGGNAGILQIWLGRQCGHQGKQTDQLPNWDEHKKSFILPHNAVDKDRGGAADQKLYHVEYVPSGTVFKFEGVIMGENAARNLSKLATVLCKGLLVGGHKSTDKGHMKLVSNTFECTEKIAIDKEFVKKLSEELVGKYELKLKSISPFYSRDASRVLSRIIETGSLISERNDLASEITATLMRTDSEAQSLARSFKHALRAKVEWLERTRNVEAMKTDVACDFNTKLGNKSPADLSIAQQLFGINGWAALVRIRNYREEGEGKKSYFDGSKLNDFTQAPIESAKYETEALTGLDASLELHVVKRKFGTETHPNESALYLLKDAIDALNEEGMELGAETTSGFGWFDIKAQEIISPREEGSK